MSDQTDKKQQQIDEQKPNREGQMGPDMSDSFEEQAALLPEENVNAPVKDTNDRPSMSDTEREEAQDAKLDVMEGDSDKAQDKQQKTLEDTDTDNDGDDQKLSTDDFKSDEEATRPKDKSDTTNAKIKDKKRENN